VIFRLLGRLPLGVLHLLGTVAGWLAYGLSPDYRRNLEANLARALGPGHGSVRRTAIVEAGRGLLELPKLWLRPKAEVVARVVDVQGWEVVEDAMAAGYGIVFLTPHLGCFEMVAQYLATRMPLTILFRPPRQKWLAPIMEEGRSADNIRLAPADLSGVRRLIRALKQREAVGLLPDQAPSRGEGVWAPFFGRPAYTMTLAARLLDTGATLVLAWGERLPWGRGYRIHFFRPAPLDDGDLTTRTAAINREIEAMILRCPGQYLWGYNRYKVPKGVPPPTP
jgi:KDO2-lipid IV(A) lauroyltransferase